MRSIGKQHTLASKLLAMLLSVVLCMGCLPAQPLYAADTTKAPSLQEGLISQAVLISDGGSASIEKDESSYTEGEVLIAYNKDAQDPVLADEKAASAGSSEGETHQLFEDLDIDVVQDVVEETSESGAVVVAELPDDLSVEKALEQLEEDPDIAYVQPNYTYTFMDTEGDAPFQHTSQSGIKTLDTTTNDTFLAEQYYLGTEKSSSIGASVQKAWDKARCNGSVTVAILDSGCFYEHEDLNGVIRTEYTRDFYNGREDPLNPLAGNYHGTHVAGIIAGQANNGRGIAGVSYNASLIPIKVFSDDGKTANTDDIIAAISYLERLIESKSVSNLRIINMSFGGYSFSGDPLLKTALTHIHNAHDVMIICAGGNGIDGKPQTKPCYPADYDVCLSVTALSKTGTNTEWSDYNEYKDLSAPGESIFSTYFDSQNPSNRRSYINRTGSSMAAPVVTGIAALLWAARPSLTSNQVKNYLQKTADAIDWSENDRSGESGTAGAVNATVALNALLNGGTAPTSSYTIAYYKQNAERTAYVYDRTETVTAPIDSRAVAPTIAGYALNKKIAGSKPAGFVTADGKLKLIAYYDRATYKVSYKANGHGYNKTAYVYYGSKLKPPEMTARGYVFTGWYTDKACTKRFDIDAFTMPAEPVKLYAKWKKIQGAISFTAHTARGKWLKWKKSGSKVGTYKSSNSLNAIRVNLKNTNISGAVRYKVCRHGKGWTYSWKYNGAVVGSTASSSRINGIRIELTKTMGKKYHVYYRVHTTRYGWMGWARDGAKAGTGTHGRHIDGYQVKLVKKGLKGPKSSKRAYRKS